MKPNDALEKLAGSEDPFLIGVRHHSPALSAAIPRLLDAWAPDEVFIELPTVFQPWIEWLGHPETRAPVAMASASRSGLVGFYPFADFSPELAAVRARIRTLLDTPSVHLAGAHSGDVQEGSREDGRDATYSY